MEEIYKPKPTGGVMGSKALGIGAGIVSGNPLMIAGSFANQESPAGKMLSLYNRYKSLTDSPAAEKPQGVMTDIGTNPQQDFNPLSPINRRIQSIQQINPMFNPSQRRFA